MRALAAALLLVTAPLAARPAADLVLTGAITGQDHQSYVTRDFPVPAGVTAVEITLNYDRSTKTVIDLGLLDDRRFRGWSGGNKARFTVGETEATPSYLSGPVAGRTMTLLLGIPNARPGSRSEWQAEIRFERPGDPPAGFTEEPLDTGPRWYRGDLHSHTAHSDGSCANDAGIRIPCPLHRSVDAAARAGLDFFAVTEHNTASHMAELRALQPAFSKLLLIPGQEVTTFFGHANVLGPTGQAEFRVGSGTVPDGSAWARAIAPLKGLVSINHPGLPSGEACMGCGWTMPNTDWAMIDAIEIVNGGAVAAGGGQVETILSGVKFWEQQLSLGRRITPIAGSDNHDAALALPDPRAIGMLRTVVWADNLSVPALLDGIRRGRVFVDVSGTGKRVLDLHATGSAGRVAMGGSVAVAPGTRVALSLKVEGCSGCRAEIVHDGIVVARSDISAETAELPFAIVANKLGWVRADIRDSTGKLLLIGNAIHLRPL